MALQESSSHVLLLHPRTELGCWPSQQGHLRWTLWKEKKTRQDRALPALGMGHHTHCADIPWVFIREENANTCCNSECRISKQIPSRMRSSVRLWYKTCLSVQPLNNAQISTYRSRSVYLRAATAAPTSPGRMQTHSSDYTVSLC